jgi:hypothetical protein
MARHYKILAYDFERSFSSTFQPKRVTDSKGRERLGYEIWKAGAEAVAYLENTVTLGPEPHRPSLAELQEAMPELASILEDELKEHWLPLLITMLDDGGLILQPKQMTKVEFLEAWGEKDVVERAHIVIQLQPILMGAASDSINHVVCTLAAVCILARIDDAAIAVDLDDSDEISACSIEIADFKRALNWKESQGNAVDIAVRSAIKQRAQSGGRAKYKDHSKAREFVQNEWEAHRDEYEGNKSAFARDYVRRVLNELNVKVTEKTLREVWLSTPTASKPAG